MSLGLGLMVWLFPHPRTVGHVTFDGQTLLLAAVLLMIGFQAVLFALFTKVFAVSEGLLPEDRRLARVLRHVSLETGLLVGFSLIVLGVGGSVYAFLRWSGVSFGPLDASRSLRWVVPSMTSLVLGFEVVLSSFFLSILGLRRR